MASILGRNLTADGSVNVTGTATLTPSVVENQSKDCNFIGHILVENQASANFVILIEHSTDNLNWETLITFTAVTADGVESVYLDNTTAHVQRYIRARCSAFTAGAADITVTLLYDRT